jgi:hypothetical protein
LLKEINPHNLDSLALQIYALTPDWRARYDLRNERHAKVISKLITRWKMQHSTTAFYRDLEEIDP